MPSDGKWQSIGKKQSAMNQILQYSIKPSKHNHKHFKKIAIKQADQGNLIKPFIPIFLFFQVEDKHRGLQKQSEYELYGILRKLWWRWT